MTITNEQIIEVYANLKNRTENPCGIFDKQGRFYLEHSDLINVREPSRAHPYSHMLAGRTLKFVKALAATCETFEELKAKAYARYTLQNTETQREK